MIVYCISDTHGADTVNVIMCATPDHKHGDGHVAVTVHWPGTAELATSTAGKPMLSVTVGLSVLQLAPVKNVTPYENAPTGVKSSWLVVTVEEMTGDKTFCKASSDPATRTVSTQSTVMTPPSGEA